ncbi:putative membrane protein [Vibrio cholerae O1 str. EC-0051]|nr:putative membrane protein [Vibrio cholerae O1 str. EC-0051]
MFFAIVGSYFLGSYFAACQVLIFILGVRLRIKYPVQR